ncbi:MAG: Outer membrane assembly lipoprotein YfiO [candidate division TM6 bacterium GW2011_GWF2_38_10]|nr:MAG: Outer membrane assembly lipoprotein YfiO [candidate division TM6 bacterium GW2011_GWF2_38_10]
METKALQTIILVGTVLLVSGCAKQKKQEAPTFDELRTKALAFVKQKKHDLAAEYLEKIIVQNPDRTDIAKYKLLLAEVYFKEGKYPSAYELYDHYSSFYPSDKRAEYAKYQSILSKFYQTLRTDCDQTQTEETIKLCKEYLEYPSFNAYSNDVKDIHKTCESKLIDKELYVFNFYLRKGELDAAKKRLTHVKTMYLTSNPALEARLLYLESQLAQKQHNIALVKENMNVLATKFPQSQFTHMAQALLHKQTFSF